MCRLHKAATSQCARPSRADHTSLPLQLRSIPALHLACEFRVRVDSMTVRTLTGRRFSISASYVVLATGGLEVARLLLASRGVHTNGIGNDRDLVGRYYMCHVAGTLGALTINRPSS